MNVAFLSLGGNMGNRMEQLKAATEAISERCGTIVKASSVYETEAWGMPGAQSYLNQAIRLHTSLDANSLMDTLLDIEKKAGRVREGHQYSDRSIDLDILFFNDSVLHEKKVWVPHPRLHLRKFVLVPLSEIEAGWLHPEFKKTIGKLLSECNDDLIVKKHQG